MFEAHYELFRVAVMQLFWLDGSIYWFEWVVNHVLLLHAFLVRLLMDLDPDWALIARTDSLLLLNLNPSIGGGSAAE